MSYTFVVSNCGNNCQIKTKFNPPLQLDPYKQYEMALVNLETYWSFPNVTEENNLFKFSDCMAGNTAKLKNELVLTFLFKTFIVS